MQPRNALSAFFRSRYVNIYGCAPKNRSQGKFQNFIVIVHKYAALAVFVVFLFFPVASNLQIITSFVHNHNSVFCMKKHH